MRLEVRCWLGRFARTAGQCNLVRTRKRDRLVAQLCATWGLCSAGASCTVDRADKAAETHVDQHAHNCFCLLDATSGEEAADTQRESNYQACVDTKIGQPVQHKERDVFYIEDRAVTSAHSLQRAKQEHLPGIHKNCQGHTGKATMRTCTRKGSEHAALTSQKQGKAEQGPTRTSSAPVCVYTRAWRIKPRNTRCMCAAAAMHRERN
jgi:hypothetical protein